jgi:Flp pilus assembly protein TadG
MTRPVRSPGERGVIAIEFMLVISMLMVVFLLMLQYAVRAHAEHIASAAAREGLAAATAYDGSADDGRRTAEYYLARLGPGLQHPSVSTQRSPTVAAITVSGLAQQFIPLLTVRIHVRVEGPVERFVEQP